MIEKISFVLVGILIAGFVTLIVKGQKVQVISTEVDIAAPPAKIWGILTDIEKWQEWSPIINKSSGTSAIGSKLNITMSGKEKDIDGPKYSPIITKLEEARNMTWKATMITDFIFTNNKVLEIKKTNSGSRLIHKETFSGMMSVIMCSQMEKEVPPMLDKMNQALKVLAEK